MRRLQANSAPLPSQAHRIATTAQPCALLALDLGSTTGWALRLASGAVVSGSVSFRGSRFDGGGMRFLRFRGFLDGLLADAGSI
ncbi:MAG: hypothetical protein IRY89_16365, partial [Pseudolabrys sp.]|nr:hypothetical protein [Pseudolabrys sp.]